MAPPVPYGHYAKDYVGDAHKHIGRNQRPLCSACSPATAWAITAMAMRGHGVAADQAMAFGHDGGSGCGDPGCFGGISCGILGHHKNAADLLTAIATASAMQPPRGPSAQADPDRHPARSSAARPAAMSEASTPTSEVILVPAAAATLAAASASRTVTETEMATATETAAARPAAAKAASTAWAKAGTAR